MPKLASLQGVLMVAGLISSRSGTARAPFPYRPAALVLLLVITASLGPASAACLERETPLLGTASLAVHDDVSAHFFNPALVGWYPASRYLAWVERQEGDLGRGSPPPTGGASAAARTNAVTVNRWHTADVIMGGRLL